MTEPETPAPDAPESPEAADTPEAAEAAESPVAPEREVLAEDVPVAGSVRVRRAPRYPAFVAGGAILLGLVGLVAALVAPGAGENDGAAVVLTALTAVVLGAVLGALVAVLADRR